MIERQEAGSRIARLSGMMEFPAERAARAELVTALAEASFNLDHADRIIGATHRASAFAPTPFDIYEAARTTAEPEWRPAPLQSCDECIDGWKAHRGGVTPCSSCPAGRARRAPPRPKPKEEPPNAA